MLANGSAKAAMLCSALNNPNDIAAALPARLTLGGTWLMDLLLTSLMKMHLIIIKFTGEVVEKFF